MTTISFAQTTTNDGQIALALSSSDLPLGGFTFSLAFNYTGTNVHYVKATYQGSAAVSANASEVGMVGTVDIRGAITPSSTTPFATILFDAVGQGSFDANITSVKVNGLNATFKDPATYNYTVLGESITLESGSSMSGTYNPLDLFFTPSYTLKAAPQHGNVTFGQSANPSMWTYTAATGFYGSDIFTLKVSDGFDTKEKTILVNVGAAGSANNDTFQGGPGGLQVDGGAGIDTVTFSGKHTDFVIARTGASAVVTDKTSTGGISHLDHVERLAFSDSVIALDIEGNGGQAYRLYQAAFNRAPDAGGLGYWIGVLDKGTGLVDVANGFINSAEFKDVYGAAPTNTQLVTQFYINFLHRQPEKAGLDYWVGVLDTHSATTAEVLASMSESPENQAGMASIIGNGFAYTPFTG